MELSDTRLPRQYPCQVSAQHSSGAMNSDRSTAACELDSPGHHQKTLSNNVNRVLDSSLDCYFFNSIIESQKGPQISIAPLSYLLTPVALLNRTPKSYDISNFPSTTIIPRSNAQCLARIKLTILALHYHTLIPQLSQSSCRIPSPSIVRIRPQYRTTSFATLLLLLFSLLLLFVRVS
jgi:hypothetical protein